MKTKIRFGVLIFASFSFSVAFAQLPAFLSPPLPIPGNQGPYMLQQASPGIISASGLTLCAGCTLSKTAPWTVIPAPAAPTITYTTTADLNLTRATVQPSLGIWAAATTYTPNLQITDTLGNVQETYSTALITTANTCLSGATQPAWNATIWGFTTDGTCTWWNQGPSTQVWCLGAGVYPGGNSTGSTTPANNVLPALVSEWITTTFIPAGGTAVQTYGPILLTGNISPVTPVGADPFSWQPNYAGCSNAPALVFNPPAPMGTTITSVQVKVHY
jgi:hypothetical protein